MQDALLVKVEGLYRYYDSHCAVEDVAFELHQGEILGFLGPNGAGKTSTMQMLSGNLAPSAGRVFIAGVDILEQPKRAKAAIGYLPEQPPLYPDLTVDEYLRYCAELHRVPRRGITAAVVQAKERCGLKDTGARLIGNLSKGFQQRVGIAQAILHSPKVVILDEPTVGLDPIQIREIRGLIRELGREHGVILSTHILPEVQSVCTKVQIIHQGRLVFSDSLEGLSARMPVASLTFACRSAPDAEEIREIDGVQAVEEIGANRLRVRHAVERNPAEALAALAVRRKWGLLELTPEQKSLEQIFVELTTGDETAAAEPRP
ncbi:MAG TPA: ATP-binding cassette domain-containing protein [Gammaproteobacteria bacterium]|nr:ATP-binding cassette domain-containing protein [Gammaproteobacteria bacterium]